MFFSLYCCDLGCCQLCMEKNDNENDVRYTAAKLLNEFLLDGNTFISKFFVIQK